MNRTEETIVEAIDKILNEQLPNDLPQMVVDYDRLTRELATKILAVIQQPSVVWALRILVCVTPEKGPIVKGMRNEKEWIPVAGIPEGKRKLICNTVTKTYVEIRSEGTGDIGVFRFDRHHPSPDHTWQRYVPSMNEIEKARMNAENPSKPT